MSTNTENRTARTEADTVAELAAQAAETEIQAPGEIIAVADGPGRTRIVDLEEYDAHPRRAKGNRTVYDAKSFAEYLHRHESTATEVYADVQTASVIGIIDSHVGPGAVEGLIQPESPSAGWQRHRITLQLTKSPSWLAWEKHDGQLLGQEEFAEFAEMQAVDVREPSPADLLELAQRLVMTKSVDYESGQRLQDGQTQLVYKETATARAGQRGDLEIPSVLKLALKPYIGGPTYGVTARFRYRLRGTALLLGYVLERPDLILESAFGDVVESLREGQIKSESRPGFVAIDAPVFLGKP
jgi:uncharacterized protein YfdQ (DUF2303 family)